MNSLNFYQANTRSSLFWKTNCPPACSYVVAWFRVHEINNTEINNIKIVQ